MEPMKRWQEIAPHDAAGIDLRTRKDITAPLNERGERCPWPWDPQRFITAPPGIYRCPHCGARCEPGTEHTDYGFVPLPGGWNGRTGGGTVTRELL
jgi:hypothetical protein